MLGQFVREAFNDVEIENGALNFAAKTVLPEIVDGLEIAAISTATFFGWTSAVNHAADKKIAEAKKAEEAEAEKKAEETVEKTEGEVVDKKGKPVK